MTPMSPCVDMQCIAMCCSALQCIAVCCSVLQCVAVCCGDLEWRSRNEITPVWPCVKTLPGVVLKRALSLGQGAIFVCKRALFLREKSPIFTKSSLYLCKGAFPISLQKKLYISTKEPWKGAHRLINWLQKRPMYSTKHIIYKQTHSYSHLFMAHTHTHIPTNRHTDTQRHRHSPQHRHSSGKIYLRSTGASWCVCWVSSSLVPAYSSLW